MARSRRRPRRGLSVSTCSGAVMAKNLPRGGPPVAIRKGEPGINRSDDRGRTGGGSDGRRVGRAEGRRVGGLTLGRGRERTEASTDRRTTGRVVDGWLGWAASCILGASQRDVGTSARREGLEPQNRITDPQLPPSRRSSHRRLSSLLGGSVSRCRASSRAKRGTY